MILDCTIQIIISRKVVGKNVYATIPKGNMRYDHAVTVPNGSSYQTHFCCLPLALSNIPGEIFENNLRDLYFSKPVFEGLIFGWAYIRRGLYREGNLRLKMT